MNFVFSLNSYAQIFNNAHDIAAQMPTNVADDVNTYLIRSNIYDDLVLSSVGQCFKTQFSNYSNMNGFQSLINAHLTEDIELSTRTAVELNTALQFDIAHTPIESETTINGNKIPDKELQNDIVNSYKTALSTSVLGLANVDIIGQDIGNYITNYDSLSSVLSCILPNDSNIPIAASHLYQFLIQLTTILEKLKLFRYSFKYKVTSFVGKMNFHKCGNIYPELPVNNLKYNDMISYYGAVMSSPLAKHYDINVFDNTSEVFNKYSSQGLNQIFSSNLTWHFDALNLTNNLIYIDHDVQSDEPTFNMSSKEGSNGEFRYFKTITNQTYHLTDHISEIIEMFDIYPGMIISSKTILSMFSYIFELWHHNLAVFQVDIYACHYNCHINNLTGKSDLTETIRSLNTYSVEYFIDEYVTYKRVGETIVEQKNNVFNDIYRPMLSFTEYKNTYDYIYNIDYVFNYDLIYPIWNIDNVDVSEIPLSVYCKITTDNYGDIQINIPTEVDTKYGESNSLPLTIQHIITTENQSEINNSNIYESILSAAGKIEFHFCYAHAGDDERIDIATVGRLQLAEDQLEGFIYEDTENNGEHNSHKMSYYFSMGADGKTMLERGGKEFSLNYQPTPTIWVKHSDDSVYRQLDTTKYPFDISYINSDKIGEARVFAKASNNNPVYKGEIYITYRISPLPKLDLDDPNIAVSINAPQDVYTEPFDPPILTIIEHGSNPIPEDMYRLEYTYPPRMDGEATVTAYPTTEPQVGDVYYSGSVSKTFQVRPASTSNPPKPAEGTVEVFLCSMLLDWQSSKKIGGFSQLHITEITTKDAWKGENANACTAFQNAQFTIADLPADITECWFRFYVSRFDDETHWVQGTITLADYQSNVLGTLGYATQTSTGKTPLGDIYYKFGEAGSTTFYLSSTLTGSDNSLQVRREIKMYIQYASWEEYSVPINYVKNNVKEWTNNPRSSTIKRKNIKLGNSKFSLTRFTYKDANRKTRYNNAWKITIKNTNGEILRIIDQLDCNPRDITKSASKIANEPSIYDNDENLQKIYSINVEPLIV